MTVYSKLNETRSTLQGITGTLKIYSAQAGNQEIRDVFADAAETIDQIGQELEKRIQTMEFEEPQYKGQ